ncbi:putative endonuclease [Catenulispora sp. MAP12-49]|uniref:YraN family protein n=1 Tax=unclassified Catenulispora TaxID=414885 RepID=UPI0035155260
MAGTTPFLEVEHYQTDFPSPTDHSTLSPGQLGREGEDIAAAYLSACGYRVLDRNWRWRGPDVRGELDIIALASDLLITIEVKARRAGTGGRPFDAVTDAKRARLWKLTNRWLAEHRLDPAVRHHLPRGVRGIRLDVIGLLFPADGRTEPLIDHLQGV